MREEEKVNEDLERQEIEYYERLEGALFLEWLRKGELNAREIWQKEKEEEKSIQECRKE